MATVTGFKVTAGMQITAAVVVVVAGLVLLYLKWRNWPWETIGVRMSLAAIVVMLLRDRIYEYGESSWQGKDNSSALADEPWRIRARLAHPFIYAVGIPLVLLGALYQVIGNPDDALLVRAERIPDGIVHNIKASDTRYLDLKKLADALAVIEKNRRDVEASLAGLYYTDLKIENCKKSAQCTCPEGYKPVPDNGQWNLNAGTTGDSITLCYVHTKFTSAASK